MSGFSLRKLRRQGRVSRAAILGLLVTLCSASAATAWADNEVQAVQGMQAESARRAEIRRTMDLSDENMRAPKAPKRRSMTAEERRRLREDIRASRDIYEVRERPGRK